MITEVAKKMPLPALGDFERFLTSQSATFEPEIVEVVEGVLANPGKRLRPMFLFVCAGIREKPSQQALRLAAITELIHLATLIHDDILDDAQNRHGAPAHHKRFDEKISVLAGDTLFLRANELAAMESEMWVGRTVAAAAKETCSGEIAQSLRQKNAAPLGLAAYEKILRLKTGRLFALACELGGFLHGDDEPARLRLRAYGEAFGIAYQFYDDMMDILGDEATSQKTLGTDQRQRKWTLPWILLGSESSAEELERLWADAPAAIRTFFARGIEKKCRLIFEEVLGRAASAVEGLAQAAELEKPLAFLRERWEALGKMRPAVNE